MPYYVGKILGDICPGSEITITSSWSGAGDGPDVKAVDHVVIVDEADIPDAVGVLTISATVNCNGVIHNTGSITITISEDGGDPGDPGDGGGGDPG